VIRIPTGADWFIWRLVLAPDLKATREEIEEHWTLAEAMHAHLFLDEIERVRAE